MTDALPDVEQICVAYLLQHAATTALVATRVHTILPSDPTWPLVRLIRIGGPPRARGTLDAATVQVESYADSKHDARLVAATVQAAFQDAAGFTSDGAYITDVEPLAGLQWIPDPDLAQKPRYLFDSTVYVRNT